MCVMLGWGNLFREGGSFLPSVLVVGLRFSQYGGAGFPYGWWLAHPFGRGRLRGMHAGKLGVVDPQGGWALQRETMGWRFNPRSGGGVGGLTTEWKILERDWSQVLIATLPEHHPKGELDQRWNCNLLSGLPGLCGVPCPWGLNKI